ncbi:MAG TPA: phenylalanine--tRNA ligase subunit beta [Clostridiales bacterium]|jgi:phenylalanyl-tRNA synthetase beta chain|nr:phenylalanine--tRNA ligase subunit beta [Clostridiales bacterium]
MKLPLRWLKEYVDFDISIDEFKERMIMRGFEIAEVIEEMPNISNVYVGQVKSIAKHENSDKLFVCAVDIGRGENIQIVTNASYLFEGAIVPVALDGATLAGGLVIKNTVLRGVESYGMFCGKSELNIKDHEITGADDRILILNDASMIGKTIQEALGLDSVIFDIEITPNRQDCQSIIGICREAAAALGKKFKEPVIKHIEGSGNAADYASVTILNPTLCPRYVARVIKDIKIEPSPLWMQTKLRSVGLRPINNIVDITNYVLIEYGHPMHAFDLACVDSGAIIVRNAYENEKITTLDGVERETTPEMLLITDPKKPVGLAGIMGGENSGITENTKAVLFESAAFIADNIRRTSRKLGLVSDSAQRFMRGVEPVNAYLALERAVELVHELGAGTVVGEVIDVNYADISQRVIEVDTKRVNRIIGEELSPEYMKALLETINIESTVKGDTLVVNVPHYRVDIESGIESDHDIAEEVARLHGYEKLTPRLMSGRTFSGKLEPHVQAEDNIKNLLAGFGAYEMYNYSFMSPADLEKLMLPKDSRKRQAVRILNPLGEDQSLMRTTLTPGMLNTLAHNIRHKTKHNRFFEVGNIHFDKEDLPEEVKMLGLAFMGDGENFFTLKGVIEALFEFLGITGYRFKAGGSDYLCPGKKAEIFVNGDYIGEMGAVHPLVEKEYEISSAYIAEIEFNKLLKHKAAVKKYKSLPKFPSVERDIAIIVDDSAKCDDVCDIMYSTELDCVIENVTLFDVYKGAGIPEGKKSMAFSYTLRRDDKTLNDKEITEATNKLLMALECKLGAKLRQ